MLNNITRSRKRFLRKCALVTTTSLFLTLMIYSSFDKIVSYFDYYSTQCSRYVFKLLLSCGFTIDEVVITGTEFVNKSEILKLVDKTQLIVYIRLPQLVKDIKSVSEWIKEARVYRILPHTLHIDIDEYKPFAIWRDKNKTSVIDSEGRIITENYQINNLVTIEGQNSLSNLKFVKDILENKTELNEHISAFIFVGNRRWNVVLNNGLTIKLPEDNPCSAWNYLNHLQNTTDFTYSDWSIVDMRIVDKIFVKR